MMDVGLGRFGDIRLEKGGPFCIGGWSRPPAAEFGFVGLVATGRARFGCFDFCTIGR